MSHHVLICTPINLIKYKYVGEDLANNRISDNLRYLNEYINDRPLNQKMNINITQILGCQMKLMIVG